MFHHAVRLDTSRALRNSCSMTDGVKLLTTAEVAQMASVHPATVRRWVEKGLLKPTVTTPGGYYRFSETDVALALKGGAE